MQPKTKTFAGGESGTITVLAAVMLPVIIAIAGLSIDYGNGIRIRTAMQSAADSAALAVVQNTKQDHEHLATKIFEFSATEGTVTSATKTVTNGESIAEVSATYKLDTTFMKILGVDQIDISVVAHAAAPLTVKSVRFLPTHAQGWWEKTVKLMVVRSNGTTVELARIHYDVTSSVPPAPNGMTANPIGWIDLGDYTHAYLEFTIGPKMFEFNKWCNMGCYTKMRSDDPSTSNRFVIDGVPVANGTKLDIFEFSDCDTKTNHSWEDGGAVNPDIYYSIEAICGSGSNSSVRLVR